MASDLEQRTQAWHEIRLGKVTASRVSDVMAKGRTGVSATRATYAGELVAERLAGRHAASFSSPAMARGTELEPDARACYQFETGNDVVEIGFVDHPTIAMAGCSPDGLVGIDGLVEIKCCNAAKHIALLAGGSLDGQHVKQVVWQMACTGRQWVDLAYYNPDLPIEMQLHVRRIERDNEVIAEMEAAVSDFLAEVDATVATLTGLYRKAA